LLLYYNCKNLVPYNSIIFREDKMRLKKLIPFFLFLATMSSCIRDNCNRSKIPKFNFPGEMEDYFGVYRLNNFWSYENNLKTKRDCVFVSNFVEEMNENCQFKQTVFERQFTLTSLNNFFKIFTQCSFIYSTANYGAVVQGGSGDLKFDFTHTDGNLSFSKGGIVPKEELVFQNIKFKDAMVYNNTDNGTKLYFLPNIGIVKIETNSDTFHLLRHRIF